MTDAPLPFVFDDQAQAKRFAPATERNRDVIVESLRSALPRTGTVLEVASGTGEHIIYFAAAFPELIWQPSDYDDAGIASIAVWVAESGLPNILAPVQLDAVISDWPVDRADAIICINMVHIAPWAATEGLFAGASAILANGAVLYLYGPYREQNVETAQSNEAFDASLKSRNPDWGLRKLGDVVKVAERAGFKLDQRHAMPANNLALIFRKMG